MFKLYQNTPTRFSSETTIAYELKQPGYVTLQVFDITGKIVATLEQGEKPAGFYRIKWNRLSANNSVVPRGIYLCKLNLVTKNNEFSETMKIVVK
jgi:flagellar hook assembly protein FlgD